MDVGVPELIIILVIVILLWGPGRLSKIGGELGSGIRAFRQGLDTHPDDVEDEEEKTTKQAASTPVVSSAEEPVVIIQNSKDTRQP